MILVYVDLAPKQLALVKNNLAYTLPVLKKEYEIFFEVFPTKWNAKWGSILHLTTSDNIDEVSMTFRSENFPKKFNKFDLDKLL